MVPLRQMNGSSREAGGILGFTIELFLLPFSDVQTEIENANLAEGRPQPTNTIEREGRTQSGENSSDANLEKIGTRILTAKGDQLGGRQL